MTSFAHPGGNATGLGGMGVGIYSKMLELLVEAVPKASRVAMLVNSGFTLHTGFIADIDSAARARKVTLLRIELRSPDEIDAALAEVVQQKADALLILGQPFLVGHAARLASFAIGQRLPTMTPFDATVHDGLLMSYGSRLIDDVRRASHWVRARYVAERDEITERYAEWEITGPGEERGDGVTGWFHSYPTLPRVAEPPLEMCPAIDQSERFLTLLFLRRYVTWCARTRRFEQARNAATLWRAALAGRR